MYSILDLQKIANNLILTRSGEVDNGFKNYTESFINFLYESVCSNSVTLLTENTCAITKPTKVSGNRNEREYAKKLYEGVATILNHQIESNIMVIPVYENGYLALVVDSYDRPLTDFLDASDTESVFIESHDDSLLSTLYPNLVSKEDKISSRIQAFKERYAYTQSGTNRNIGTILINEKTMLCNIDFDNPDRDPCDIMVSRSFFETVDPERRDFVLLYELANSYYDNYEADESEHNDIEDKREILQALSDYENQVDQEREEDLESEVAEDMMEPDSQEMQSAYDDYQDNDDYEEKVNYNGFRLGFYLNEGKYYPKPYFVDHNIPVTNETLNQYLQESILPYKMADEKELNRRIKVFKQFHSFEPDPKNPNVGYMTINGHRVYVDMDFDKSGVEGIVTFGDGHKEAYPISKSRISMAFPIKIHVKDKSKTSLSEVDLEKDMVIDEVGICLDRKIFYMNKPERIESVVLHELGHVRNHYARNGLVEFNVLIPRRDKFFKYANKHITDGNEHTSPTEFEADRYSGNIVGDRTTIKAMKDSNKIGNRLAYKAIKDKVPELREQFRNEFLKRYFWRDDEVSRAAYEEYKKDPRYKNKLSYEDFIHTFDLDRNGKYRVTPYIKSIYYIKDEYDGNEVKKVLNAHADTYADNKIDRILNGDGGFPEKLHRKMIAYGMIADPDAMKDIKARKKMLKDKRAKRMMNKYLKEYIMTIDPDSIEDDAENFMDFQEATRTPRKKRNSRDSVRDGYFQDLPEDIKTTVINIHKLIKQTVNNLLDNDDHFEDLKDSRWAMSCIDDFCVAPEAKGDVGSVRVFKKGKTFSAMIQSTGHFRNHEYGWIEELLHDFIATVHQTIRPIIRKKYDYTITNEGKGGEPFEGFDVYPPAKRAKELWDLLDDRKTKVITESGLEIIDRRDDIELLQETALTLMIENSIRGHEDKPFSNFSERFIDFLMEATYEDDLNTIRVFDEFCTLTEPTFMGGTPAEYKYTRDLFNGVCKILNEHYAPDGIECEVVESNLAIALIANMKHSELQLLQESVQAFNEVVTTRNLQVAHRAGVIIEGPLKDHHVHIIYDLNGDWELTKNNVVFNKDGVGHKEEGMGPMGEEGKRLIRRYGNTDFRSKGHFVKAVKDMDNNNAIIREPITYVGAFKTKQADKDKYPENIMTLQMGTIDNNDCFKSTFWHPIDKYNTYEDISHREGHHVRGQRAFQYIMGNQWNTDNPDRRDVRTDWFSTKDRSWGEKDIVKKIHHVQDRIKAYKGVDEEKYRAAVDEYNKLTAELNFQYARDRGEHGIQYKRIRYDGSYVSEDDLNKSLQYSQDRYKDFQNTQQEYRDKAYPLLNDLAVAIHMMNNRLKNMSVKDQILSNENEDRVRQDRELVWKFDREIREFRDECKKQSENWFRDLSVLDKITSVKDLSTIRSEWYLKDAISNCEKLKGMIEEFIDISGQTSHYTKNIDDDKRRIVNFLAHRDHPGVVNTQDGKDQNIKTKPSGKTSTPDSTKSSQENSGSDAPDNTQNNHSKSNAKAAYDSSTSKGDANTSTSTKNQKVDAEYAILPGLRSELKKLQTMKSKFVSNYKIPIGKIKGKSDDKKEIKKVLAKCGSYKPGSGSYPIFSNIQFNTRSGIKEAIEVIEDWIKEVQGVYTSASKPQAKTESAYLDIDDEMYFGEKSNGMLKIDHRLAKIKDEDDPRNGHFIHIIYNLPKDMILTKNNVVDNTKNAESERQRITGRREAMAGNTDEHEVFLLRRYGNTDHQSYNQKILAIYDLATNEKIERCKCVGPFPGVNDQKVTEIYVGMVETKDQASYKSTYWHPDPSKNIPMHIGNREGFRIRGMEARRATDMLINPTQKLEFKDRIKNLPAEFKEYDDHTRLAQAALDKINADINRIKNMPVSKSDKNNKQIIDDFCKKSEAIVSNIDFYTIRYGNNTHDFSLGFEYQNFPSIQLSSEERQYILENLEKWKKTLETELQQINNFRNYSQDRVDVAKGFLDDMKKWRPSKERKPMLNADGDRDIEFEAEYESVDIENILILEKADDKHMLDCGIKKLPKHLITLVNELNQSVKSLIETESAQPGYEQLKSSDTNMTSVIRFILGKNHKGEVGHTIIDKTEVGYTGEIIITPMPDEPLFYSPGCQRMFNRILKTIEKKIAKEFNKENPGKRFVLTGPKNRQYFIIALESEYAGKLYEAIIKHRARSFKESAKPIDANEQGRAIEKEVKGDMSVAEAKKVLRKVSSAIINKEREPNQYAANIYANIITKNLLPEWAPSYRRFSITMMDYQSFHTVEFKIPKITQDFISRFIQGRESLEGFLHRQPEIKIKMSPRVLETMKSPDDAYNFFHAAIDYYDKKVTKAATKLLGEIMRMNQSMKHLVCTTKLSGLVVYPMTLLFSFSDVDMTLYKNTFTISQDDIKTISGFIRNISSHYAAPEKERSKIVSDMKDLVRHLREECEMDENIQSLYYLPEAVSDLYSGKYDKEMEKGKNEWINEQVDKEATKDDTNKQAYYLREAFGVKKLKKIPRDLIAYIQIEGEAIKTANDKLMIASYCLGKLEIVEWYIELIETGSKKYIVPHTKEYLESMRIQLLACYKKIMATPIPTSKPKQKDYNQPLILP